MSLAIRSVKVPPYCGLPRLSHQFPAAGVGELVTVFAVVGVKDVVEFILVVDVVIWGDCDVSVGVDVVLVQDAKNRVVIMIHVNGNQLIPLFMSTSFHQFKSFDKIQQHHL